MDLITRAIKGIPNAPQPYPPEMHEGDYIEDGVIHCGKCHFPRERIYRLNSGDGFKPHHMEIPCMCIQDEIDEIEQERETKKFEEETRRKENSRLARIAQYRREAFADRKMEGCTFEKDDGGSPQLSTLAHNFVDNFSELYQTGKGLLLYGGVGTGKSFATACIVNALIEDEYSCHMTSFSRIANELLACSFEEKLAYADSFGKYALLVIDDFGSERDTQFMDEVVYNVINARYQSGKPIIVTTNLSKEEIMHPKTLNEERVTSRLFEMCLPFEITGKDRRKQILESNNSKFKNMLLAKREKTKQ